MGWKMEGPALKLVERLTPTADSTLPFEILKLNEETASIVIEQDGVDYILTMMEVQRQRERPSRN